MSGTKISALPSAGPLTGAELVPVVSDPGGTPVTERSTVDTIAARAIVTGGAVPATRTIAAGTGLTGGGDLTTNRTVSIASDGVGTPQIADDAVTYAKLQDITSARLLGRATAGSGNAEEITLGTNLSFAGTTLNAIGGISEAPNNGIAYVRRNLGWESGDARFAPASGATRAFYPETYGAVGDGALGGVGTNDRVALQACIDAASAAGGGEVMLGPKLYRVTGGGLIIPERVRLISTVSTQGLLTAGVPNPTWENLRGGLLLDPGHTVRLRRHAEIERVVFIRDGLTRANNLAETIAGVRAFAGTAVTLGTDLTGGANAGWDTRVKDCFFLGFGVGVYCADESAPRYTVSGCLFDCTTAFHAKRIFDYAWPMNCEAYPFYSAGQPWNSTTFAVTAVADNGAGLYRVTTGTAHPFTTGDVMVLLGAVGQPALNNSWTVTVINSTTLDLQGSTFATGYTSGGVVNPAVNRRMGIGFHFERADGTQAANLATFGWRTGFKIEGAQTCSFVGCIADSAGYADPGSFGFLIDDTAHPSLNHGADFVNCSATNFGTSIQVTDVGVQGWSHSWVGGQVEPNSHANRRAVALLDGRFQMIGTTLNGPIFIATAATQLNIVSGDTSNSTVVGQVAADAQKVTVLGSRFVTSGIPQVAGEQIVHGGAGVTLARTDSTGAMVRTMRTAVDGGTWLTRRSASAGARLQMDGADAAVRLFIDQTNTSTNIFAGPAVWQFLPLSAGEAPRFETFRNLDNAAAGTEVFRLRARGRNDAAGATNYGSIAVICDDPAAGVETGAIRFLTMASGVEQEAARITGPNLTLTAAPRLTVGGENDAVRRNSVHTLLADGTGINLTFDVATGITTIDATGGGTFLALTDTPPSYTGQAGRGVRVNSGETGLEFFTVSGSGTVTSVALSGGTTGLTVSGSPITTTGTITLAGTLAVANGGTGATSAGAALAALSGQPLDATLTALAALSYTSGRLVLEMTAADTFTLRPVGAAASTDIIDRAAGDARFAAISHTQAWTTITATPTTRSGYGITDAAANTLTLTAGTGLTGGGDLTANRSFALTGQALALNDLATNGVIARTGAGTVAGRTLTAGANIIVTNGDGVSGNPTIAATGLAASGAVTASGLTMATARLLGRNTAGTGAPEEITLGTNLSLAGTTLNATGGGGTILRALSAPGLWLPPPVQTTTTGAVAAGRCYFSPMPFAGGYTMRAAAIRVSVGSAGNVRFGLYIQTGTNLVLSAESAATPSTASAAVLASDFVSDYTAPDGLWWLCSQYSATPTALTFNPASSSGGGFAQWAGNTVNPPTSAEFGTTAGIGVMYFDQAYASGLPATVAVSSLVRAATGTGSPVMWGRTVP